MVCPLRRGRRSRKFNQSGNAKSASDVVSFRPIPMEHLLVPIQFHPEEFIQSGIQRSMLNGEADRDG